MTISNDTSHDQHIERLRRLEYAIRQSIAVREDQEDDADPGQQAEAEHCGLTVSGLLSKGDLLNLVQTAIRSGQTRIT